MVVAFVIGVLFVCAVYGGIETYFWIKEEPVITWRN